MPRHYAVIERGAPPPEFLCDSCRCSLGVALQSSHGEQIRLHAGFQSIRQQSENGIPLRRQCDWELTKYARRSLKRSRQIPGEPVHRPKGRRPYRDADGMWTTGPLLEHLPTRVRCPDCDRVVVFDADRLGVTTAPRQPGADGNQRPHVRTKQPRRIDRHQ